jgi:hypothetical protein
MGPVGFVIGSAWAFDHGHAALGAVLEGAVDTRGVDYAALKPRRAALGAYLDTLAALDPAVLGRDEQVALYVNAYNGWTLATILDAGIPASITELDGGKVWDTRRFRVAGAELTLNQLEHGKLRPLGDPRIHAALNCASKGCPPLAPTPMNAATVDAQLEEAARRWAATNAFTVTGDQLALSQIFDWYGDDFVAGTKGDLPGLEGEAERAVWFLSRFVPAPTVALLQSGKLHATWQDYDWSLNLRRP